LSFALHGGEELLRWSIALSRSQAEQPSCLRVVLRATLSIEVHDGDAELRFGMTLSRPKPK
jgi:hypothetical protein